MDLDIAIKYYSNLADDCRRKATPERNDYMDLKDLAAEHEQLAGWLNELKILREKVRILLEKDKWTPCNEKPEYDFQNVLVRWRDKRKGCEKDYYIFEGYVVRGIWCGLFEDADISDFEPIEWKPLEDPYTPPEK